MGAFSDDPEKVEMCMEFTKDVFIGEGNQVTGQLPTSESLFASALVPRADLRHVPRGAQGKGGPARCSGLPGDLHAAPDRHRDRPHGEATPEEALDEAYKASLAAYEGQ